VQASVQSLTGTNKSNLQQAIITALNTFLDPLVGGPDGTGWPFGRDVYRFIFAAKNKTVAVDRSFRESVATFRRMSLKESEQIHPLHLKIVTVGAHDTVEKLAHRMAVSDHKLERFRVINGLGPNDRLKPGEQVKIVVE